MDAVREVTQWKTDMRAPNHVYLMDGAKAVAYIQWGEGKPIFFKTPIRLDKRGRKFVNVSPNPFKFKKEETRIKVQGSKGSVYWVDPDEKTCTCAGFTFRGACKHLKEVTFNR